MQIIVKSIWPIDGILAGITTAGQSYLGVMAMKSDYTPQSARTKAWDAVLVSYLDYCPGVLSLCRRCSWCWEWVMKNDDLLI